MTPVAQLTWRTRVLLVVLLAAVVALSFVVLQPAAPRDDIRVGPADCPSCAATPRRLP